MENINETALEYDALLHMGQILLSFFWRRKDD